MQIHYALCDPSHDTGGGNYWTWYAETLPLEMLQDFYKEFPVKNLPKSPSDLAKPNLWDNFAPITVCYEDWTVVYRFFSGGNDKSGRPGRYIILTAWMKTEEAEGVDLSSIQRSTVFRDVGNNPRRLPMPKPTMLSEERKNKSKEMKNVTPAFVSQAFASPTIYIYGFLVASLLLTVLAVFLPPSRISIIVVSLLSFLLGLGASVVLQHFDITFNITKKDDSNENRS